jgi:curved DNA-binding protein CbpA
MANLADPYKSLDVSRDALAPDVLRAFWKRALLFNSDVTREPTARERAEYFAVTRSFE